MSTDPRFSARAREAFLDALLPGFGSRAACAELAPNRAPWSPMFEDDVSYRQDGDYAWPAGVREAMKVCASCPVRRECLSWAFEVEKRESRDWWTAELVSDNRRFGVLGGCPGRIRERFDEDPDPVGSCEGWFRDYAREQGWKVRDLAQEGEMTA